MSNKILILFAHPRFEQSRTNQVLVRAIPRNEHITFHDLYEHYADFNVDIAREQRLLLEHDIIIWHHPMYWYSSPPLLKQWIDMVLAFGWAYGPGGEALKGKSLFNVFTSGGPREVYQREGRNRFTVREFLTPFEQTARLCHMHYLPPFGVQGTHRLSDSELASFGQEYAEILTRMINEDFNPEAIQRHLLLNDWLQNTKTSKA